MGIPLDKEKLRELYVHQKFSAKQISRVFGCSEHKVNYWLLNYNITKRSISEAIYVKYNPKGDPFRFESPKNIQDAELFGFGLGLYWGEGNKANKNMVKLGNSDPALLKTFIKFLTRFFNIKKSDLRFHLHLFSDIDLKEAKQFWMRELKITESQIYKPTITKTGSLGTYRKKSKYGVFTVHYINTKLRNIVIQFLVDKAGYKDEN